MIESLPPGHPNIVLQYVDYGNELGAAGRVEEAHAQFMSAAEWIDKAPSVRAQRTAIRTLLAWAAFETGRHDEALSVARQAVETGLADHGLDHMRTLQAYGTLMNIALELGHVDEAERTAASLARVYAAKPTPFARQKTMLEGNILADIANRRGNAKQCERLARGALAAIAEAKGSDDDARIVHAMLAECLIGQRRFREAREEIAVALDLARKLSAREDVIALSEINLARIEIAEGKRQAARERAQAARTVLEKYPSQVIAKRRADEILGKR
jgi:tetratricopeptide (TPR) repeat protein